VRGRIGNSGRSPARGGRRSGRLVYAAVALFCVLWVAVIALAASFGGSDEAAQTGSGGEGARPSRGAEQAEQPEAGASGGALQGDASQEDGGDYREVQRGGGPRDGRVRPSRSEAEEPGSPGKPAGTRLPQEAAVGEPAYDPLGKGPAAGDLSETDEGRVRLAAFRFVDAAYDFEGTGADARVSYIEDVNWTVDSPEFWQSPQSPGGRALESVARRTQEYGVKNSAAFRQFRIEDTSSERVIGTAVFSLDEGDGEKTYRQQLVLRRWAAVWRVLYAKQIEEVS